MKVKLLFLSIALCIITKGISQDANPRYNNIKNNIETLKIETPGLDEALNINVTQTTLSNFLLAIAKVHELNISVAPELNSIQLVNNFSNVAVADILLFLVKEYNLDIDFTGNILSISTYEKPEETPEKEALLISYNLNTDYLNLDINSEPLSEVFRKIMDETGKNLLFTPDIERRPLTLYLKNVPFTTALNKLATTNDLILQYTEDGFYTFESAFEDEIAGASQNPNSATSRPKRRRQQNFYYKILDSVQKRVEVDLQNTPIADVIYTLGEELNLDIFTATSLDDIGTTTVTSRDIIFDNLLDDIFRSLNTSTSFANNGNNKTKKYTYKSEGNAYYFGEETQLTLKQTELVTMMHRSVRLLDDPSGGGQRRAGRNNFNSGNSSFFNNGFQNQSNQNQFNQNNRNGNTSGNRSGGSSNNNSNTSIEDLIPEDVKEGLDIKIDAELNSFIVSGPGIKVERFKEFVTFIDKPVPVILIEVMIVEVNKSTLTETGISFGLGDQPTTTQGEFFPGANVSLGSDAVNTVIGNFNGFGALNIGQVVPNFYLDIKAMESAGTLKVKSTPSVTTLNGHKAYLTAGETTYYAVTSQNFFGSQNPQLSEVRNYVPIDAELALEILPFVSGDGQITLDIQVIQSAFNGERIADDAPPGLTSREFSSIVRMQDQDIVVLGGIESIRKDNSGSGVPLLARIPIIKYLFSKRRREATKRNLNVLIKPTVIY